MEHAHGLAFLRIGSALSAAGLVLISTSPAAAQMTQNEALNLAFPDSDIERRTAYLTEAQMDIAEELAGFGIEVNSGIITHYVATKMGDPVGVAYFDAHRVRTLPEVLMIVVGPDSRVQRVEVVAFREPPEYSPPRRWLEQFDGRNLEQGLSLRGGEIRNMTGASLTSEAGTWAVRRTLALHQVIAPFGNEGT